MGRAETHLAIEKQPDHASHNDNRHPFIGKHKPLDVNTIPDNRSEIPQNVKPIPAWGKAIPANDNSIPRNDNAIPHNNNRNSLL